MLLFKYCSLFFTLLDVPQFPSKIESVSVNEGEEANFVCKYIAFPTPDSIQWFKNDTEELIQSETIIIETSESNTTLRIMDNKLSDSGSMYHVVITNKVGKSISNKAKLNVSSGPAFIVIPKDQSILRDKETKFECVVTSNPKPVVTWYLNEKELTIKDGVRIEKDIANDKYSLVIPKTSDKNLGTYTVKATNEFGSSEKKCSLEILESPKILNKLDNLTVNENTSASFTVKFSGKPSPKTQWFKNETEIEIDELYDIDQSIDNQVTFTIKSCSSEDHTGSYFVKVSNEFGELMSNKATLAINCKNYFYFIY